MEREDLEQHRIVLINMSMLQMERNPLPYCNTINQACKSITEKTKLMLFNPCRSIDFMPKIDLGGQQLEARK